MKRNFLLLALFLFVNLLTAQTSKEKISDYVQRFVDFNNFNGTFLIVDKGEILFEKAYGFANKEWQIPNTLDTKFRIGSITKQFTSMLVMMLYEEGKIKLDGKISDYLDYYRKDTGEKITILQLLNHTSGIPSYTSDPEFWRNHAKLSANPHEFVQKYCSKDLDFEPGTQWVYNNSAYFIVGAIIEKITGLTYEQALAKMIFEPLEMTNSGIDSHIKIIEKRADGYDKTYIYPKNSDFADMSTPYAAGAIYSTVGDLFKWDRALYTEKLISNKTKEFMLTPVMNDYANGWGVGMLKFDNGDSTITYSHSGGVNGFQSFFYRLPEKNQAVIAFSNLVPVPLGEIVRNSLKILNGDKVEFPKPSLAQLLADKIKDNPEFDILEFYKKLKDSEELKNFSNAERDNNTFGYELLNNNMEKAAISIFKMNIDSYPESFNVYDSMGEAFAKIGEKDEAIKNYQKALEINPNFLSSKNALQQLGVEIEIQKNVVLSEEQINLILGKYQLMPNFVITVTNDEQKIFAQATGQTKIEMTPISELSFINETVGAQFDFEKSEEGIVESLILFQNGQKMPAKKIE